MFRFIYMKLNWIFDQQFGGRCDRFKKSVWCVTQLHHYHVTGCSVMTLSALSKRQWQRFSFHRATTQASVNRGYAPFRTALDLILIKSYENPSLINFYYFIFFSKKIMQFFKICLFEYLSMSGCNIISDGMKSGKLPEVTVYFVTETKLYSCG